jgi:UDP-glucose 4-epimerase
MGGKYFLAGGAGFIGSHFVHRLLGIDEASLVTVYDNFSSGKRSFLGSHLHDERLKVVAGDIQDLESLARAIDGHDVVIHLASNPDIARAATEPDIDFYQGTLLTNNILEAMRTRGVGRILYASGSGVYGDLGTLELEEDFGPLIPVSTYGASKLAGEALISAYCHMFNLSACVFRFANVVGPRQTHGVGLDFIKSLLDDPSTLRILGDGTQSKSYIHVEDVVEAVMIAHMKADDTFGVYNVASPDYITVREIAGLAVDCVGRSADETKLLFTGGNRGWRGDVPVVRLNTNRIADLGWKCEMNSRQAMRASMLALMDEIKEGELR